MEEPPVRNRPVGVQFSHPAPTKLCNNLRMRLPPGWTSEKGLIGVPVFVSDLIGEDEVRCEAYTIVVGRKVDLQAVLFHVNLTEDDRQFLRQLHVSTEIKSAYER